MVRQGLVVLKPLDKFVILSEAKDRCNPRGLHRSFGPQKARASG